MRLALRLARRGLGQSAPNPAVGCILVKDGRVVGRGWTQPGGRPHAEMEALTRAKEAARGAQAYVVLEPCAHHGVTGPCASALIAAGIARCHVAIEDPDERVAGRGLALLRQAGIEVRLGLEAEAAARLNAGYLSQRRGGRPWITLKLATSLDGKIALPSGESRWITGTGARLAAHLLRAQHDAVLVGHRTFRQDRPRLDVRLPGFAGRQPAAVVVASHGLDAGLLADWQAGFSEPRRLLVTGPPAKGASVKSVSAPPGFELLPVLREEDEEGEGRLIISSLVSALAGKGFTRLLIEGGGELVASFLRADLFDELVLFQSGLILGAEARPAIGPLGLSGLAEAPRLRLVAEERCGEDVLLRYERR